MSGLNTLSIDCCDVLHRPLRLFLRTAFDWCVPSCSFKSFFRLNDFEQVYRVDMRMGQDEASIRHLPGK
jgi:hypothetical protein